jgi:hypothetical protein
MENQTNAQLLEKVKEIAKNLDDYSYLEAFSILNNSN